VPLTGLAFQRVLIAAFWIPGLFSAYAAFAPHGVPLPVEVSDVVLHLCAFGYLTAALGVAYYAPVRWLVPVAWMALYGVAIEAIQYFIPTRDAEVKDLVVDAFGIALGLLIWLRVLVPLGKRLGLAQRGE